MRIPWKRHRPIRLASLGSVPPEWGGRTRGGVATLYQALIEELLHGPARGIDIAVVLPFNLDPDQSRRPPTTTVGQMSRRDRTDLYRLIANTVDVVMFHHVAHEWTRHHRTAGRPAPAVGVVHSWHAITDRVGEDRDSKQRQIQEALDVVDRIVVPSRWAADEGLDLGLTYPVEPAVIHYPLPRPFLQNNTLNRPRNGVVYVGTLNERKNPMALLEAAPALPGVPITFVGTGELEECLRARAQQLGLVDQVRFAGPLTAEQVRDELLAADVMCLPSRSESFGIVYTEALACGTPVVGFGGTIAEIEGAVDTTCGVGLADGSPEEVASALRQVLERSWDRALLSNRAVSRFSPSVVADSYATIIRQAAKAHHHGGPSS